MRDTVWCILIAVSFYVGYVAGRHDARGGDYMVSRGTTIESERPIGLLVLEAGVGAINGARLWKGDEASSKQKIQTLVSGGQNVSTALHIDGSPAPGIRGVARAGWRLLGFLLWNADGSIERVTDLKFRGRSVRIVDAVSNGRVWVRVVVGPPLGDPRVQYAVLTLEATENEGEHIRCLSATGLVLSCSAVIDLPGDRCRLVRRIARRIANREAGPPIRDRVDDLAAAGRAAVLDGRGRLTDSVVAEFLERVCR